jgi:hypothetical protein
LESGPETRSQALERAILRTVAYADIFDYPLQAGEIQRVLIGAAASLKAVRARLEEGFLKGRLSWSDGYYTLPGREELGEVRRRRAGVARELWPPARRYGRLIGGLPFVRMVAVTGALAVDNVEAGADLDYLVVTRPGRLWVCRALVIGLVRWAARDGVTLCPNYFLAENSLTFPERSLYTAYELVQMVPLAGFPVYARIRRLNRWTADFLPNAGAAPPRTEQLHGRDLLDRQGGRSMRLVQASERLLASPPGGWFDRWEMQRKIRKFQRQGGGIEAAFCADWCKGHFDGHARRTLDAYAGRVSRLDLEE